MIFSQRGITEGQNKKRKLNNEKRQKNQPNDSNIPDRGARQLRGGSRSNTN
jgi:hypothetical protein